MKSGQKFRMCLSVLLIVSSICVTTAQLKADVRLPAVLSDHMVLQRNIPVKIWGWAEPNEQIEVLINQQKKEAVADKSGAWAVTLDPMSPGGPYDMVITGANTIKISDILIGDVWICSGQSNMEWRVERSNNAAEEIAAANYPKIRLFDVKRRMAALAKDDFNDETWAVCTPENIIDFSAVGYFFGRELHYDLNIPIGLISTNWGGSVVETWMSPAAIDQFPEFSEKMTALSSDNISTSIEKRTRLESELRSGNIVSDRGMSEKWYLLNKFDPSWAQMNLPQRWEDADLKNFDGVVWYFKEIEFSAAQAEQGVTLHLGSVDDSDVTYINGVEIGRTMNSWDTQRMYPVKPELLQAGKNVLCVRVIDTGGSGGFRGQSQDMYVLSASEKMSLAGSWFYKNGTEILTSDQNISKNSYPTLLFNGMVHPLLSYAIKGTIWYQGESNAGRAYQYRSLFPAMIRDWRSQWDLGDFPFLFVQLANYKEIKPEPGPSEWAELREAQNMALELPNTGVAVTIDIGETDDIHPRNKQDVGHRLALAAKKIAYGQDVVYSGPMYKSMQVEKGKVRIAFDHVGSGLMVKDPYGYLKGFAIAGPDKNFVWAKAYLDGNDVIVYNEAIEDPVAVRYGWADNPHDVNLYNKEGLPASPFRTDDWRGITGGGKQ